MKKTIISILLVVCLSIILYGCNNESGGNSNPSEKATYDEETVKSYFTNFGQCAVGYKFDFKNQKELVSYDVPKVFKNNMIYNYLKYKGKITSNKDKDIMSEQDPKIDSFTKKDLEEAVSVIFGMENYDILDTFDLGDYSFEYDSSKKKYTATRTKQYGCGDEKLAGYSVNSVYVENNNLLVNVLYYDYEYQINELYIMELGIMNNLKIQIIIS